MISLSSRTIQRLTICIDRKQRLEKKGIFGRKFGLVNQSPQNFIAISSLMPLNCSTNVAPTTRSPIITKTSTSSHVNLSLLFKITKKWCPNRLYKRTIACSRSVLSGHLSRTSSAPLMEDLKIDLGSQSGDYSRELDVAVRVVQMACSLCQRVQEGLIGKSKDQVKSKDDDSPVTVADWSVQAIVSWVLSECFGSRNVSIIAEEDVHTLSKFEARGILEAVVKTVNECLAEAPMLGLNAPDRPLGSLEVLEAISRCNSTGGPKGRHWVLDPVDGTLGFVRGDQYAVALALIENGEVVLGVLGCPNYPMKKEWLNYHHRYFRLMSKLSPPTSKSWEKGCVMYAKRGSGEAWMQPLVHENKEFVWPNSAIRIQVSSINDPGLATFCEPVEKANSSHSFTAGLAHSVGLRKQPLRVYSMVKYAAIARGDAEIFMKFARAGYKEKIWDHAVGVLIIHEAGGMVTDAGGRPLDFSKGIFLEGLDRGIIACSGPILHERIIDAVNASWDSSNL